MWWEKSKMTMVWTGFWRTVCATDFIMMLLTFVFINIKESHWDTLRTTNFRKRDTLPFLHCFQDSSRTTVHQVAAFVLYSLPLHEGVGLNTECKLRFLKLQVLGKPMRDQVGCVWPTQLTCSSSSSSSNNRSLSLGIRKMVAVRLMELW